MNYGLRVIRPNKQCCNKGSISSPGLDQTFGLGEGQRPGQRQTFGPKTKPLAPDQTFGFINQAFGISTGCLRCQEQSSVPGFILSSINSHTHAGTALNCTLQGGLRQLVLGRPFSTVVYDQDKSIKEK